VFDLLWGEKSQLCTEEAKKRSILNKLWDGEISKRFLLMNNALMHSLYLAKIFWLTSSKKRFGGFNWLISGEKEEQKNVNNEHKR
jgi:hypothetical protein